MNVYVKHYLGAYNFKDQVQRCVICGEIIHDYRGGSFAANADGSFPINNGWVEGDHYVSEQTNPTIYSTTPDPDGFIITCNTPMLMPSMEERKNAAVKADLYNQHQWESQRAKAIIEGIKYHQDIEDQIKQNTIIGIMPKDNQLINTDFCNNNILNKTMNKMQIAIGVKMIAFQAMTLGAYNKYRGWDIPKNEDPNKQGYLVEYTDSDDSNHPDHKGYISWSPKEVFDNAYYPIEDQTKITRSDIEGFLVKGKPMQVGPKTTLLQDTTLTGFDITATSACVDPANYDANIGGEIARKRIIDELWGHMGFVLQWAKNGLKAKE